MGVINKTGKRELRRGENPRRHKPRRKTIYCVSKGTTKPIYRAKKVKSRRKMARASRRVNR